MTSAAEHEPERLSPGAARWLLGVAYLVLASLYAWQASQRVSPSIFSDEIEFTQISRGIAATGMPKLDPVFSGPATVASASALTCRCSRWGRTCSSFVNARVDVSSIPRTPTAARRPMATATASSSSSRSGGSLAPMPSR